MKKIIIFLSVLLLAGLIYVYKPKEAQDSRIVLSFSFWGSQSETAVLNQVIQNYELNNPDIKINCIHVPKNYFQKLQLLFASGLEPDIIFINSSNIKMYINAGLIEDLTPFFDKSDFFPQALNCFSKNGKIYAVPRDISNLVIYYNKDLLNNINLTSINDILAVGKKLREKNIFAVNSEDNPVFWLYYLSSAGGGALSDDLAEIIINSDASLKSLKFCSDLINKYHYAPDKSEIGSMTTAQMFINGKIAMYLGGRWMVPKFRETVKFNWDVAGFPVSNPNKVYIDASGFAVSKNSKHKKEAVDFVKYLSSKECIEKFTQDGLIVPARKSASDKMLKIDKIKKPYNSEIFINMLNNAKPTPVNENYGTINDILTEKAQIIFYSNKPPEDAFDSKTIKKLESLL